MNTTPQPDKAKIRRALNKSFDDPGLKAFCHDYFPQVNERFARGMRKDEKITELLDYCSRQPSGFKKLFDDVCKEYKSNLQRKELKRLIDALEVYIDSLPSNEEEVKDPNVRESIVTKPEEPKITTFLTKSLISSRTKLLVAVVLGVLGFAIMGGLWFVIYEWPNDEYKNPINISVIVALPVEQWVIEAAERYNREGHLYEGRKIQVEVIPMDGLDARGKWERGEFDPIPTVWLAESSSWVDQANIAAVERTNAEGTGQDIFLQEGPYGMKRVVLSPIVWGIWLDAYQDLVAEFGTKQISWDEIYKAAVIGDWGEIGGGQGSGKFKLMIANPKRDPAGLTAIVAAAGAYFGKPTIKTQEVEDPEFQKWLSTLLDTVVGFSLFGVENIILYGQSNGDAAMVLESELLINMQHIVTRWGQPLQIVYPDPIAWFDFPYAIYMGEETSAAQKEAALEFKDYLLHADRQAAALEFGLRPACVECPTSGGLIAKWEDVGAAERVPSTSRMGEAPRSALDALAEWFDKEYEE